MRVLVCGSRTFNDRAVVSTVLDGLWQSAEVSYMVVDMAGMTLIEGGATGADALASEWAQNSPMHSHNERPDDPPFQHLQFHADWQQHGRAAGPIRNQQMLEEGEPDEVWAFVDKPLSESRGTADMVRRAKAAGIPTYVVEKVA